MFTKNQEYKKRIIEIFLRERHDLVSYLNDMGLRIEPMLLSILLYEKYYLTRYKFCTDEQNFGLLKPDEGDDEDTVDEPSSKPEENLFEIETTYNNFGDNIITLTNDIALIPSDIGLVVIYKNIKEYKNTTSKGYLTIFFITWSFDNAERLNEYIRKNLVIAPREKNKEHTYNIAITSPYGGLTLKKMKFRNVECDISKNYNDDLPYDKICELLNSDKQELILFYGPPGTGKTTLIKQLINKFIDKKIIVMDTNNISTIGDDKFFSFLYNNSDSIVILEDCDKILKTRESGNNIMSTLLNLTDGLIGESFNIKFICTFNTSEKKLDEALLRKGRTSLMYKFNPLDVEKVKHIIPDAKNDMTLADIYHYQEKNIINKETGKIGFNG